MQRYEYLCGKVMISQNISLAKELMIIHGKALSENHRISSLLSGLREIISAIEIERIKTGVASECAKCGALNTDCCGKGIELRYSKELLLINLLLGVNLPRIRYREDSCYFLGPKGCSLMARDVFCVNFLCRKITDTAPPSKFHNLRELEGRGLTIIFTLEEQIKAIIGSSFLAKTG